MTICEVGVLRVIVGVGEDEVGCLNDKRSKVISRVIFSTKIDIPISGYLDDKSRTTRFSFCIIHIFPGFLFLFFFSFFFISL